MTPIFPSRPACGPSDSICLDQDSGAELVPLYWPVGPGSGGELEADARPHRDGVETAKNFDDVGKIDDIGDFDDYQAIERGEVPPLERCLGREPSRSRWASWARLAPAVGTSAKRLAVARAARALAGGGQVDRHQWQDVVSLCLSERLDISSILDAVPRRSDQLATLPGRLLQEERLAALALLLPHLRRGAWGDHACLAWRGGTYFGDTAGQAPEGEGFWRGHDGTSVRGAWRLGATAGPSSWRRGALLWRGPVDDALARHGSGELALPDDSRVRGTWTHGLHVGDALVLWPDGRRYYGPLASEAPAVPHGQGRCDGADGSRTEGWFDHGLLSARGTFTYPQCASLRGWRYVGPFVAGRKHGRGHLESVPSAQGRSGRPRRLIAVYDQDRLLANSPAGCALAHLGGSHAGSAGTAGASSGASPVHAPPSLRSPPKQKSGATDLL